MQGSSKNCKIIFLQDFVYLASKASFLVQDFQDMCKILQVLQEKYLARFAYFLQDNLIQNN